MPEQPPSVGTSATDRLWAVPELLLATALVIGANLYDVVPISETPWLVLIGWLSLRLAGRDWRSVGLRRPSSWTGTILSALAAAALLQLVSAFAIEPLILRLTGEEPDLSEFSDLVGNLPQTLLMLALVWIVAAFGEELSYRGYVMDRVAALGKRSAAAYVTALILVSLLFGLGHWYQGVAGVISSAFSGLFFGTLYLVSKRNLWLPILAHGFSDTIALTVLYLGLVPGL